MILRTKRQTIPIVCIVHFIITQYGPDSKQKFSSGFCNIRKPTCRKQMGFCYRKNIVIILMHIATPIARIPGLVKKHFRHRRSIHSPFR